MPPTKRSGHARLKAALVLRDALCAGLGLQLPAAMAQLRAVENAHGTSQALDAGKYLAALASVCSGDTAALTRLKVRYAPPATGLGLPRATPSIWPCCCSPPGSTPGARMPTHCWPGSTTGWRTIRPAARRLPPSTPPTFSWPRSGWPRRPARPMHSAEALLSLLNDILDFSKIESGKLDLEVISFSLRSAVEDVAYTLAKRAHDKGLEIACLIDPDLSSNLRGDPGRVRQILVNLVGNAIKFTHQGEIIIRAESVEQNDHHSTIHFSVQDTGIGIPYERQAAVFERFTQADGSTTRTYGGTGLGLTISKQLVEIMGGKIGLHSTPGIGTTFWFDIKFEDPVYTK